jgi:hypothetical protein
MVAQRDACLPRGDTQLQPLRLDRNQSFDPEESGDEGEVVQTREKALSNRRLRIPQQDAFYHLIIPHDLTELFAMHL